MLPPNDAAQLTDEDLLTLKKCRQMAFWKGSVPCSVGALLLVSAAKRNGFFSKRRGLEVPCCIFAVTMGYFIGKLTFIGKCKHMFLQLKNSRIKDQILELEMLNTFQSSSNSPIIVNTPVEKHSPMSYAQRREYYQQHSDQSIPTNSNSKTPEMVEEDKNQPQTNSNLEYFDRDRPVTYNLLDFCKS
ncbi:unnamed protein product [Heterobilharzia americana]|nr:unnamed protein product [Heterobilharzia americana]